MVAKTPVGTVSAASTTPYKLDPEQTLKASKALLTHIKAETKKLLQTSQKKSLIATEDSEDDEGADDDVQPVWLTLSTKQHIVDKNRLKPSKIRVPHSLHPSENLTICLITTDPQRALKNAVADPAFPSDLSPKITKIIGLQKLIARYKSFESRRQLLAEHDIFLADDRVITRLPKVLGKVFYKSTAKRPIPISISPRKTSEEKAAKSKAKKEERDATVAPPSVVAAEIQRALACVPVSLRPGTNVAVRVGLESFTPQQLDENINVVVPNLIEKHVVKGWRNVKSISIKSPTSFGVPIWLSDDLWTDDDKIAETAVEAPAEIEAGDEETKKRKRNPATTNGPQTGSRKKAKAKAVVEADVAATEKRKKRLAAQKTKAFSE